MQQSTQIFHKPDREKYLASLPAADENLLQEMRQRYPDPFDTLPVQIRSPHCWRLFVKFCLFSGLPIAEGETHYHVKSSVAVFPSIQEKRLDEEIALSHDVMEGENLLLRVAFSSALSRQLVLSVSSESCNCLLQIAFTHELLAVNGEVSAEILRLPNQKVFDYLRRQYSQ